MGETLLEMRDVKIYFPVRKGILQRAIAHVKAVDGVSLSVEVGDALGLVGESGSGKTTLVNGVTMLERLTAGSMTFQGQDLKGLSRRQRKQMRRCMQIVFQDPFWSLNPRWLVRDIVGEPVRVHDKLRGDAYQNKVVEALEMVGMGAEDLFKYPHEFSGGMRQRIAIARALILQPRLVVLDEPTSAIDVLSQHQILLMLQDLKERLGLTFILVSHDLSVVGYLATKIAVMYCGQVVEYGETSQVLSDPLHPYAQALLSSVPELDDEGVDALGSLPGSVASALDPPPGCRFHPRCEKAMKICSQKEPPRVEREGGRYAYCWLLASEGGET
ncbi:MAG: ABC transporter ATP-binding protein [Thermoleophilia bacterium]|nr:ABC transporter ATP-binding protein [Thermoleophilia bacterium]